MGHEEEAAEEAQKVADKQALHRFDSRGYFTDRNRYSFEDEGIKTSLPERSGGRFLEPKEPGRDSDFPVNFELDAKLEVAQLGHEKHGPPRFESLRKKPVYQDLTHREAYDVQLAYKHKLMLERKVRWLKLAHVPRPKEQAKAQMREELRERAEKEFAPDKLYPAPVNSEDKEAAMINVSTQLQDAGRLEEIESRKRTEIRRFKLENAALLKQKPPQLGGSEPTDPMPKHERLRVLRLSSLVQEKIEGYLTQTSSQILHEYLEGAAISVLGVDCGSKHGAHYIRYQISRMPEGRDANWVQDRLRKLVPKIRSQMAINVNLGYTPKLKFMHQAFAVPQDRRRRLMRISNKLRKEKSFGLMDSWSREMNWSQPGSGTGPVS